MKMPDARRSIRFRVEQLRMGRPNPEVNLDAVRAAEVNVSRIAQVRLKAERLDIHEFGYATIAFDGLTTFQEAIDACLDRVMRFAQCGSSKAEKLSHRLDGFEDRHQRKRFVENARAQLGIELGTGSIDSGSQRLGVRGWLVVPSPNELPRGGVDSGIRRHLCRE